MRARELRVCQQEAGSQRFEGHRVILSRQIESLELVYRVVSEQEQVEVGLVREEVLGRGASQGVAPFEFSDDQIERCPIVVEPREIDRLEGQVGQQYLIGVTVDGQQRELGVQVLR